ncbi:MAG: rhodanese-like domain-containing protein [Bacillota bacterium]|uniref:Rhodanese-like domain-containing protein n=1 Tax=Virgibacillus salarius TaxID=447199 RepID=A0A941DX11_9BACI|nr:MULTISPECIES: rhodanese-like domain-containing protein [Bacillaceae]NAZ07756.1 rhodanese-like domain-containing protein [Agaribacter marinus]MBR7795038.1 rhodanese-like domain-containing protein [Virgibacillus salarius]MCC2248457.1 rhodanese-like domain-containing protein [Virgibacillus sp. AGTR]MDY7043108.1 rhodanese-like domain-containing protein [Virgibacillus sp. M23]QRZ16678.1 rhodanese-like domain-containing protein [Virgibacillus sp. AGTR]
MKEITTKELAQKVLAGEKLYIIDVREDNEVAQGKIPGANHIKLGDIPDKLGELDQKRHYYMVCRSGGRSGKAATFLEDKGFDVTNVAGGMLNWEEELEK